MQNKNKESNNRTRTAATKLELTVGINGDLTGTNDKTLQAGVDYLHRLGGGTLRVLPGHYAMDNALYLRSGVRILGHGEDSVLQKKPSVSTELTQDADWYENQVFVADKSGFLPGCGIILRSERNNELQIVKRTITAVGDNILHLDSRLGKNFWVNEGASVATLFPLLTAEYVDDLEISDIVLDGAESANESLNGNYVGGLFIQHCNRHTYKRLISRNYAGDGFSFQVCDDIEFFKCSAINNQQLGFHPGSGSQRPVFRHCSSTNNSQGIFFCWGVTGGKIISCTLSENKQYGVSIGHRDTDNHILKCIIERNGKYGLLFRKEINANSGAHNNTVEECLFRDNGFEDEGVAVQFDGTPIDTQFIKNRFEYSDEFNQKVAIRYNRPNEEIHFFNNKFVNMKKHQIVETDEQT